MFDLNLSETHFDLWRLLNYYPFFLNSSFCERISMFPLRKKCFSEIYTFWQRLWFYNFLKLLSINSIYRFFVYVLIFFHMERRYALNEVFFPPYKWITMCLKYLLILNFLILSFSPSLFFFQPFNRVGFWCFQRSGIWIDCWNHWVLSGCWESKKRLWRWFWAYGDDFECTAQTVIEKEAWMFIDSYSTTQLYATYSIDKKL